jgi:hypothetical protein
MLPRRAVITKAAVLVQLLITNVILIVLSSLVAQDLGARIDYARSIGFTPSVSYSPLAFVLSSVGHGTSIPGLLTFDWFQFLLIVLILLDGSFALETLRR